MRVAIAHDYLREYGGAERVLEALLAIFPNAPLYTAYYNPKSLGANAARFNKRQIHTSWFQKFRKTSFILTIHRSHILSIRPALPVFTGMIHYTF